MFEDVADSKIKSQFSRHCKLIVSSTVANLNTVYAGLVVARAREDSKISVWMKNGHIVCVVPQPGGEVDENINVSRPNESYFMVLISCYQLSYYMSVCCNEVIDPTTHIFIKGLNL